MRVLLINKFYHLSGGAERYVFEWQKILRARGHDVMVFSMHHPRNEHCREERFFVDQVRFATDLSAGEKLSVALHSVWSREATQKMRALLKSERAPDIAHLHSFMFQLTPSILEPLRQRGVPIVQTCHEYAYVCVNQHLYNHRTNNICEACLRRGRLSPLRARCIKGSFAASATGVLAGLFDTFLGRSATRIRRFLTPSAFMQSKMVQGGLPASRVFHVPNFVDVSTIHPSDSAGDYILFLGRLVAHKGIMTFLKAAESVPDVPCKIAGDGPLTDQVRAAISCRNLENVELLGFCEGPQLWEIIRKSRVVVVPSEWFENGPLAVLEAMAAARPVIATRIAGIPEMVEHGCEGILFEPGSAEALAEAMALLWQYPDRARYMGRLGRRKVETRYNPDVHYDTVMSHFEEVVG